MAVEDKWRNRAWKYHREQLARAGGGKSQRRGAAPGSTTRYIWRIDASDMSRTRPDHRRLNGKMFRWDDPPVVNHRSGERGHPGMDGRCRCWAEAVPDEPA